jgi:hypothetical protein
MSVLDRPLAVMLSLLVHSSAVAQQAISITEPTNGTKVCTRHWVKGETTEKTTPILIVHPVSTGEFWAQEPVAPPQSGKWQLFAHFGRPNMDVGEEFEVLAYIAPRIQLGPGQPLTEVRPRQRLDHWPDAGQVSNSVTVTRANCLTQR